MYFSHPWPLPEFPSWNRGSFTNCLSGLPENHSQITKWRKEVRAVLKEAIKKDREGSDGLAAMLVMLAHSSKRSHFFSLLMRDNPDCKKWMLSIERRVVIPPGAHMADFTTALAALFACCYVFNLEYRVEASTTLEFVQRFLVRINPDSNKCTAKEQMSKTTGRVVKRKTSYMNPHVISFIRDFTEFYLLTD